MFKKLHYKVRGLPTPLAGLALGIASLGWCLENALPLAGWGQTTGAVIGLVMIGFLVLRFTAHHEPPTNAGTMGDSACLLRLRNSIGVITAFRPDTLSRRPMH